MQRHHQDQSDADAAHRRDQELADPAGPGRALADGAAASATLKAVMAVASFTRDSPWRIVVIREGSPTRRATAAWPRRRPGAPPPRRAPGPRSAAGPAR